MSDVKDSEHEKNTKRLYVKSEIPISSMEYKKILSDVSQKRQEIERKEAKIKCLKYELQNDWHTLGNASATRAETSQITTTVSSPERSTANSASSTSGRTKIVTPGGTKRKGNKTVDEFLNKEWYCPLFKYFIIFDNEKINLTKLHYLLFELHLTRPKFDV